MRPGGGPPRVGIVGARRARQGLGPFVARFLARAGAQVPCFLATSVETGALAADELRRVAGIDALACTDAEAMVREHELDALAVLSPPEHHAEGLRLALRHELAVLCEKPLVWSADGDPVAETGALLTDFAAAGLLLMENCQWPETLPAYEALFPGALDAPPRRFEMHLSPDTAGAAMIVDSASHALSLLQAVAPGEHSSVEQVVCSTRDPDTEDLTLDFRYLADDHVVQASLRLRRTDRQPRDAGYALDGRYAERWIRTSDYALFFADGARTVPVPDPLEALVSRFVAALRSFRSGEAADTTGSIRIMGQRAVMLRDLHKAFTP